MNQDLPGTTPSPFDPLPTFWRPFDRAAAAGMGEMYGSAIRALDQQRTDSANDALAFLDKSIATGQAAGHLSEADGRRLRALAGSHDDGHEPSSAAQLFEQAMDDEESSVTGLTILSIAKYIEAEQTTNAPLTDEQIATMAYGVIVGPAGIAAEYIGAHLHVSWK